MTKDEETLILDTLGFKFVNCADPKVAHWVYGKREGYYTYPDGSHHFLPLDPRGYDCFVQYVAPFLKVRNFGYSLGEDKDGYFCCIFSYETDYNEGNYDPKYVHMARCKTSLPDAIGESLLSFIKNPECKPVG